LNKTNVLVGVVKNWWWLFVIFHNEILISRKGRTNKGETIQKERGRETERQKTETMEGEMSVPGSASAAAGVGGDVPGHESKDRDGQVEEPTPGDLMKAIMDLRKDMDRQFGGMKKDMDKRFSGMKKDMDRMNGTITRLDKTVTRLDRRTGYLVEEQVRAIVVKEHGEKWARARSLSSHCRPVSSTRAASDPTLSDQIPPPQKRKCVET